MFCATVVAMAMIYKKLEVFINFSNINSTHENSENKLKAIKT